MWLILLLVAILVGTIGWVLHMITSEEETTVIMENRCSPTATHSKHADIIQENSRTPLSTELSGGNREQGGSTAKGTPNSSGSGVYGLKGRAGGRKMLESRTESSVHSKNWIDSPALTVVSSLFGSFGESCVGLYSPNSPLSTNVSPIKSSQSIRLRSVEFCKVPLDERNELIADSPFLNHDTRVFDVPDSCDPSSPVSSHSASPVRYIRH